MSREQRAVACSVLVPVLNEERHLSDSLAAICAQRFDGDLEFIFADGGSTDHTRAILEASAALDPRIRIYDNPRRTVTSGLNVALAHARGRWVARMDAHTRYRSDYLALGVNRLQAGGTRWVSGPPLPEGHGRISRAVALALGTSLGRSGSRKWSERGATDQVEYELDSGVFAGVWERRTLLEYGGWDERWVVNEDSELAGRFLARGERLVCLPAMVATYSPRNSLAGLWRQYLTYGRYRMRTARRHPQTLRRQHLVAPTLVATVAAAVHSPRPARRAARAALTLYAGLLGYQGVRRLPAADPRGDAALVPVVLATMHLAWGVGTWLGIARYGPPLRAAAGAIMPRLAPRPEDGGEPVHAPSLAGSG